MVVQHSDPTLRAAASPLPSLAHRFIRKKYGSLGPIQICMELHVLVILFLTKYELRGGGSTENPTLDANRPSLRWMTQEAIVAGIYEGLSRHKYHPSQPVGSVYKSLTPPWWILEICPIKRLTYQDESKTTWWCVCLCSLGILVDGCLSGLT